MSVLSAEPVHAACCLSVLSTLSVCCLPVQVSAIGLLPTASMLPAVYLLMLPAVCLVCTTCLLSTCRSVVTYDVICPYLHSVYVLRFVRATRPLSIPPAICYLLSALPDVPALCAPITPDNPIGLSARRGAAKRLRRRLAPLHGAGGGGKGGYDSAGRSLQCCRISGHNDATLRGYWRRCSDFSRS